ncbi:MAG: sodium-extruding oxaloacetate decarboxylase subunit alpha [Gammaproteobacteria bacterium]
MRMSQKIIGITEVVLRDGHQSLLATRFRYKDMVDILSAMDQVGYWSVESWGGAIFDSCIRYLGEDPWERIRNIKSMMPNTPQQMLLRGQNLLGYKHYADDVVDLFVERSVANGVDVFRVFDALNDVRNMDRALKSVKKMGGHAQGTISYTTSPVHTIDTWVELSLQLQDLGADSLAIKDMAGLLKPYVAFELVSKLKEALEIPVHMQCHATTGMSTATGIKAIEAGLDNIDTSISSMSMTYGHSPTEAMVAILDGTNRSTNLDLDKLEPIAEHFKVIRKKYKKFEGSLRGIDSRILVSQVPGGMLTNLENQLRDQNASDKFDEVLMEIPKVREDLGFIPLVTPTSQIVGTQSVINVLSGERYKNITKETRSLLLGEYGRTPIPVNEELQQRVSSDAKVIDCRPADLIDNELETIKNKLADAIDEHSLDIELNEDNILIFAMFPEIGLQFLKNINNPEFFEEEPLSFRSRGSEGYSVNVNGEEYVISINPLGEIEFADGVSANTSATNAQPTSTSNAQPINAQLGGNIFKVLCKVGDVIALDQTVLILEAMKMETEVKSPFAGTITSIDIKEGDAVTPGQLLLTVG